MEEDQVKEEKGVSKKKEERALDQTMNEYVSMIDSASETKSESEKKRLIKQIQEYVVQNSYIIQKHMQTMDVKDKMRIITKLRKFKEEEIENKIKGEKNYVKTILLIAIIAFLGISAIAINNKDQILVIITLICIIVIAGFLMIIQDYIYDIASSRKELKNIDSWLEELRGEESIVKQNVNLKKEIEEVNFQVDTLARENREVNQKNKQLESEIQKMKEKLEEMELKTKR